VPRVHLTEKAIVDLERPAAAPGGATRQILYFDTEQPRLAVRVTSGGSRAFVVEAWSRGRTVRVKLADCSSLSLKEARRRAHEELAVITRGVNPNEERRAERARSVTLAEAFEAYVATRKAARRLAERTEYDYRRLLYGGFTKEAKRIPAHRRRPADPSTRLHTGLLSPWRAKPLAEISPAMVAKRHAELLEQSGAQANYAMRLLSAVYNFARARYRPETGAAPIGENPVRVLSETKAWVRIGRKDSVIRAHQLPAWFAAVLALESPASNGLAAVVRDYLQLEVLTGLRPGEGQRLRWADVDLKAKLFTVRDTKNKTDHTLPLSDYLVQLLERRERVNEWVFAGPGRTGHLVEPKKMLAKVREAWGVDFTVADLRRTFISIAESIDIPAYALKRLLNHKMTNDVTAGYIVTDVERLRAPMQKITDFVLRAAGLRDSAEVIEARFAKTGSDG
jgi:integrase